MRKLLLVIILAVSSTHAAEQSKSEYNDQFMVGCELYSNMAKASMTKRQQGANLADVLKRISGAKNVAPEIRDLGRSLAIEAFGHHRYGTQEYQQAEITEFANDKMILCLQSAEAN